MRLLTLLTGFLLFSSFQLNTYDTENRVRKILVIPFDRFQLYTEYKLEDINKVNKTSGDEYYVQLSTAFFEAFEINSTERVIYRIIEPLDLQEIKSSISYEILPKEGHYTCDLEDFKIDEYKKLLDKYDCDYLMTINWYRIMRMKSSVKVKKTKKIGYYSYHYIDYDVFTREQTNLLSRSNVKIQVPTTEENFKYMGLRIQDLKPMYKELVDGITPEITSLGDQ